LVERFRPLCDERNFQAPSQKHSLISADVASWPQVKKILSVGRLPAGQLAHPGLNITELNSAWGPAPVAGRGSLVMHIRVFLRARIALAAIVTIFAISGTAVSTNAYAQGIAVPPTQRLTIPDLPCATPSERRQLQKLHDEYEIVVGQSRGIEAQLEQLLASPEYKQWQEAKRFIKTINDQGYYKTSDEKTKYENALATEKRLRPLDQKANDLAHRNYL
jgi:hypothetical protein